MGGFFGVVSKEDCVKPLFYGTDYHSHLGTKRGGLVTHDGELVCTIAEGSNVTVAVATFAGDFRASFPISLQGRVDRRFEFTLGSGSARLKLEAFDGEIHLIRPGEAVPEDWE